MGKNINSVKLDIEYWLKKSLRIILQKRRINLTNPTNDVQQSEAFCTYAIRACICRINQYLISHRNQNLSVTSSAAKRKKSFIIDIMYIKEIN